MHQRIERGFAAIDAGQLHFRRVGSGPPVVLLHPSPQSSLFSVPMALRLAKNFTAIAVDTPGYGLSDALPGRPTHPALTDYLPALQQLLDALNIRRAAFYGNATGAEIAHLFAHGYPERVAVCMIDTAGHRDDLELDRTLHGYFPDATPRRDGGHLQTHWDMVRSLSLFSPWQKTTQAQRLDLDLPPPAAIHGKLLDYLAAGGNYAAAYRPAFYTAKHELIRRLTVPSTLTRWEGKPDLTEVDDLIARGLPGNFTVLRAGPSVDERLAVAENYLLQHYLPTAQPAPPAPPQWNAGAVRLQKQFVMLHSNHLLLRRCDVGRGVPLLALHDAPTSSLQFAPLLAGLLGVRPLLAPDLPGCGDSELPPPKQSISIEAHAQVVAGLLDLLGVAQVDVLGWGRGGQVAIELARGAPQRVRRLVHLGPLAIGEAAQALANALEHTSLQPRWDGAHLATAWSMVRDRELFFPWCERTRRGILWRDVELDAEQLDLRVQELLKQGELWRGMVRSSLDYPTVTQFAKLTQPCAVADRVGNASTEQFRRELLAANSRAVSITLPQRIGDWVAALRDFLDATV